MKKTKKKYRLKKWAQYVYSTVGALCFCFLIGISSCDFSFLSIVLIGAAMGLFALCGYMLNTYGREE